MKRERGHVVAENNFFRAGGIVEIRHGAMGFIQNGIRCDTGGEGSFMVGIAFQQILVDAFKGLSGDLRAPWIIEEYRWAVEGWELVSDGWQVKSHTIVSKKK